MYQPAKEHLCHLVIFTSTDKSLHNGAVAEQWPAKASLMVNGDIDSGSGTFENYCQNIKTLSYSWL